MRGETGEPSMSNTPATILFLFLLFVTTAHAATGVLVATDDWREAYAASLYAAAKGYPMRFVQDAVHLRGAIDELQTLKLDTVELFSRKDGPVPSVGNQLRGMDLDVRDFTYEDAYALSALLAERLQAKTVIVVRDDFAFDALSARYLSYAEHAPILYVHRVQDVPDSVRSAIAQLQPAKTYALGRLEPGVLDALKPYGLQAFNGKDEYATNNLVNLYALGLGGKPPQAILTTGDILETTLLNPNDNPFLLVPVDSSYSLIQTADLISKQGWDHLLGIGQGIASPGYFLKDRTGVRIYVKFGSLSTNDGAGFERKDIQLQLEGFRLPQPQYTGKIVDLAADYAGTIGKTTGALLLSREKPAPSADFSATFENGGNIEIPVYVLFTVRDNAGKTLTTLQSEVATVYPGERRVFTVHWENPPAEGTYTVEAAFSTDVYQGITFPSRTISLDLKWLFVWLALLVFALVFILLLVLAYNSNKLLRDLKDFTSASSKVRLALEELMAKITKAFK